MGIDYTELNKNLKIDPATTFIKAVRTSDYETVREILKHDPDMEQDDDAKCLDPRISLGSQYVTKALTYAINRFDYEMATVLLDAAPRILSYRNLGIVATKVVSQVADYETKTDQSVRVLDQLTTYMRNLAGRTPEIASFQQIVNSKNPRKVAQNIGAYMEWNREKNIMMHLKRLPWQDKLEIGKAKIGNIAEAAAKKQNRKPRPMGPRGH